MMMMMFAFKNRQKKLHHSDHAFWEGWFLRISDSWSRCIMGRVLSSVFKQHIPEPPCIHRLGQNVFTFENHKQNVKIVDPSFDVVKTKRTMSSG